MAIDPVSLAITVALDAASMALTASQKIEGPRVTDLSASVADYGTPLNYIYGSRRLECPCFYCEPIKEKKSESKTKGGKYTQYKYSGTFAMLVVDGAIDNYSRIWFDRHLVWSTVADDATALGHDQLATISDEDGNTVNLGAYMRQYFGAPDQPADPRMVAYISSKEGPDRCPSYLDLSYLMFEGLPLEFIGNRFPQVSVQCSTKPVPPIPSPAFLKTPFTLVVAGGGSNNFQFNWIPTSKLTIQWEAVAHDNLGNTDTLGAFATFIDNVAAYDNHVTTGPKDYYTFDSLVGQYTVSIPLATRTADGGFTMTVTSERELTLDPFTWENGGYLDIGWAITWGGIETDPTPPVQWDPDPRVDGVSIKGKPYYAEDYEVLNDVQSSFDVSIIPPGPSSDVTLGYICGDLIARAGLSVEDFDFSGLDQVIPGFSWTIGTAKQIAAPLLDIYDSDIFPHNFQLSGRKRGGELDGNDIYAADLIREQRPDSSKQPLYQIIMEAESDLPRRVFATYADLTADQQANTAVAQRNFASTSTVREVPIDVTNLALTPDAAQPLAERWLRRQHIGGTTFLYTASPGEMWLECADLRLSILDNMILRGRLTRMVLRADRSIQTEWAVDSAVGEGVALTGNVSGLIASPGATQLGRPPDTVFSPTASRAFVLDIPLVDDTDDQTSPFAYVTAGRTIIGGTFPGSDIQQSDTGADGTWVAGWDSVSSNGEAVWGDCSDVLPDALPWIPDRSSTLTVAIPNGALISYSDDVLNANPSLNLAAIGSIEGGWEIVQFGEAELVSPGNWQISNFFQRGAHGTESFIPTHEAGELFILLSSLGKHNLGAGKIGDTDYYRSVTATLDPESADQIAVDFTAQAHRPLSPVHAVLSLDAGTGDWSGTFVRRTRIGGGSVNGQNVPLGEASESYHVKVMNGATVVRTIAVVAPAFTYVAADQTTDFGSPQTGLTVEICQMDPTLSIEGAALTVSA